MSGGVGPLCGKCGPGVVWARGRIILRRRNCFRRHLSFSDAPRPDTMWGILLGDVDDSGAHVLGSCCPEAVGCALKGMRWRSHKEVCGRTSAGCALDCGQENYGPGWSCGVGAEEVPRRDPRRALWWPRWLCCRSCEGPQWLRARGPRVCCGAQRGEEVPHPGTHKEVCGLESTAQGGHVAQKELSPASGRLCGA